MASRSLASRIAGTLASEQQAAAAAAGASASGTGAGSATKEAIPKSLAGAVDAEAEITVERVKIDGLVRLPSPASSFVRASCLGDWWFNLFFNLTLDPRC